MLASDRRLSTWLSAAKESFHAVKDIFPVSNSRGCLPQTPIEDLLNNGSDYPRVDLMIALRALKVIEQLVFSRSSGVSGPLTAAVSVSVICEVTPSFVSVLHSMSIFLSYNMTEKYGQQLIADRERQCLWDWEVLNMAAVLALQFDNWDIKPLQVYQVDGKALLFAFCLEVNNGCESVLNVSLKESVTDRPALVPEHSSVWVCLSFEDELCRQNVGMSGRRNNYRGVLSLKGFHLGLNGQLLVICIWNIDCI